MLSSKKKADRDKARHITMLARMYPGLRIAYVDNKDRAFYSVLSKNKGEDSDEMVEEYRIRVSMVHKWNGCEAGGGLAESRTWRGRHIPTA